MGSYSPSLPAQLPAELLSVTVPQLAKRLGQQAATLDAEAAREGEALHLGAQLVLEEQQREGEARRLAAAALVLARRIGRVLVDSTPAHRPGKDHEAPLPDLTRAQRKAYRACAEPTEQEWLRWLEGEPAALTRKALAAFGRKLRKERDRQTGEPITNTSGSTVPPQQAGPVDSPDPPGPPASSPGDSLFPAADEESDPEASPVFHRAASCLQLLDALEDEVRKLPHELIRDRVLEALHLPRQQLESVSVRS